MDAAQNGYCAQDQSVFTSWSGAYTYIEYVSIGSVNTTQRLGKRAVF